MNNNKQLKPLKLRHSVELRSTNSVFCYIVHSISNVERLYTAVNE